MYQKIFHNKIAELRNLFRSKKNNTLSLDEIPRYPPFAKGLPLASTKQILETQKGLLIEIKNEVGESTYERYYLPCITNYVDFVNLLPASEQDHHRGAGGLFRHGLEVAKTSLIYAKHEIFDSHLPPSEIHSNEPKWHLAAFLSGLVHDIGKPLSDYQVVSEDGSILWNPFAETLYEWGKKNEITKYFINWQKGRYRKHESLSSVIAKNIITDEALSFMTTPGNTIIRQMFECVTNQPDHKNSIYTLVKDADHHSTKSDIKHARIRGEDINLSVPVEKYVLDAIKRLNVSNGWGSEFITTSPFVFSGEKLFLKAKAMKRVTEAIIESKIPGVPWGQKELTESLINMGVAIPRETADGNISNVWPLLQTAKQKPLWAIQIKEWSYVFPDKPLEDKGYVLLSEEQLELVNNKKPLPNPTVNSKKAGKPKPDKLRDNQLSSDQQNQQQIPIPDNIESNHTEQFSHEKTEKFHPSLINDTISTQTKEQPNLSKADITKNSETTEQISPKGSEVKKKPKTPLAKLLLEVFKDAHERAFNFRDDGIYVNWLNLPKSITDKKQIITGELKSCFVLTETSELNHLIDGKPVLIINNDYLEVMQSIFSHEKKIPSNDSSKNKELLKQADDPKTPPLKNHRKPKTPSRKQNKSVTDAEKPATNSSTRKTINNDGKSLKKENRKTNNKDMKLTDALKQKILVLPNHEEALRFLEQFEKDVIDKEKLLEELKICYQSNKFAVNTILKVFNAEI
jgi:hypothetical protein